MISSFAIIIHYVISNISVMVISKYLQERRSDDLLASRKRNAMIHRFTHMSETQCQYICSKLVNCIVRSWIIRD